MAAEAGPPHLAVIDALRGVAVLGVIVVHCEDLFPFLAYDANPLLRAPVPLINQGGFGVQLFFVLSALTLLMSWHGRQEADPTPGFLVRRAFRVVPMFWAALLLYLALDGAAPRAYAPDGVAAWQVALTALFLHGWHPLATNAIVPGGWSIAAEMSFYLLFPFLARAVTSVPRALAFGAGALALAGGAAALYWRASGWGPHDAGAYLVKSYLLWWAPSQLPVFAVGFLVYFALFGPGAAPPAPRPAWGRALIAASVAIGVALPYLGLPAPNLLYLPYAGVFGLLLAGLLLAPSPRLAPRWLVHVGKVSYSAYFLHFLVIRVLGTRVILWMDGRPQPEPNYPWIFLAYTGVAIATTIALSTLTYRWIERPGIAAGRRALALVSGRLGRDAG